MLIYGILMMLLWEKLIKLCPKWDQTYGWEALKWRTRIGRDWSALQRKQRACGVTRCWPMHIDDILVWNTAMWSSPNKWGRTLIFKCAIKDKGHYLQLSIFIFRVGAVCGGERKVPNTPSQPTTLKDCRSKYLLTSANTFLWKFQSISEHTKKDNT